MRHALIHKERFSGRVILLGFGAIGRCSLPILLRELSIDLDRITIIDASEPDAIAEEIIQAGGTYRVHRITRENMNAVLSTVVSRGDLLLNLAVGVSSINLGDWCQQNGILYLDTALQLWEEEGRLNGSNPSAMETEYALHQRLRELATSKWSSSGPTAIFTHGANPGLVSHFVKEALLDLSAQLNLNFPPPKSRDEWARLAMETGTKVIHVSERDTQKSKRTRHRGEFPNTWSVEGLIEEAKMMSEIGWGTHEKTLPPSAEEHTAGPGNAIYLNKHAASTRLKSWVPLSGEITGLVLPHSECITLSDYLTVFDGDKVVYRPTVVFVYQPSDMAMEALRETMKRGWISPDKPRIMNEEVFAGRDELGVLLLGHPFTGWWYGSVLDVHQARRLVPDNNSTAVQVAAGVVAAAVWATKNPTSGFHEPEHLPHDEILDVARGYLGPIISQPTDWVPKKDSDMAAVSSVDNNAWQFSTFLA